MHTVGSLTETATRPSAITRSVERTPFCLLMKINWHKQTPTMYNHLPLLKRYNDIVDDVASDVSNLSKLFSLILNPIPKASHRLRI